MRKLLFYAWCIGWSIVFGLTVRWVVRSIAENYGVGVMVVAVLAWVGACFLVARRIDKADAIAAAKAGYMPGQPQPTSEASYLPLPDDSKG